jgi:hypothetical protein
MDDHHGLSGIAPSRIGQRLSNWSVFPRDRVMSKGYYFLGDGCSVGSFVMSYFRCYLLNTADKIVSVDSLEAEDDGAAMEMAGQLILSKHTEFAAIEVWDCARCVGKVLSPRSKPNLDSLFKVG